MRSGPPCLSRHTLLPWGVRDNLPLQRLAQEWQVLVALDPVQVRLDGQRRAGDLAVRLLRSPPPIDRGGVRPELCIERPEE